MSSLIKNLLEESRSKRSGLVIGSLVMVSTIFVSVAVSYHLSMAGIKSSTKIHQETLEERHAFINKTIESVASGLRTETTLIKTELASAKGTIQSLRSRVSLSDRKLRDLAKKFKDAKSNNLEERKTIQEALTNHIETSSNSLNSRIDELFKNVTKESLRIQADTNGTEEEISEIKEMLSFQTKKIEKVEVKTDTNADNVVDIEVKMTNDREAVENITKMYNKVVLVTKIVSTANFTNDTALNEMVSDLEDTMKLVEDNKLKEAFQEYNKTIQKIISEKAANHDEAIGALKDGIKNVYLGMRTFMYKSLGYVALPSSGMYHVWNHVSMPFVEAKEHCEKILGHLVEFHNKTEEDMLLKHMRENYDDEFSFWIGARDAEAEASFMWEQSGEELSYFNWHDGEPNNAGVGEDCVEVSNFQKWNDLDCDEYRLFVCEFDTKYNLDISV
eukprot:GFUD01041219.1.p1 GENE.GFUD01041219.1~~GFUD01041219.1.p1  ORF type:complete len:465 (+),score=105.82 GFUD01041219.1:61-1395(+)